MGLGAQLIGWPIEFVDHLASQGFRVIRFDNRDSGLSTKSVGDPPAAMDLLAKALNGESIESPYSLSTMADDAVALLDFLGYQSAHIVGASMGGMIAQTLAIDHPTYVLSLTSICSTTGAPELFTPTEEALEAIVGDTPEGREEILKANVIGSRSLAGPIWDEQYATFQAEANYDRSFCPDGVGFQIAAIAMSGDRTSRLTELLLPVLIIHGAVDPLLPLHCGLATAKAIPESELVIYDDMGHDLPSIYWPEIAQKIRKLANHS
tara:strand:+ start:137 stop:928 length:792 start_codon:yes stop_codon:yes gene_type:complete